MKPIVTDHSYIYDEVSFSISNGANWPVEQWKLNVKEIKDVRRFLNLKEPQKLNAIKFVKETIKCGLIEAVAIVDYIDNTLI